MPINIANCFQDQNKNILTLFQFLNVALAQDISILFIKQLNLIGHKQLRHFVLPVLIFILSLSYSKFKITCLLTENKTVRTFGPGDIEIRHLVYLHFQALHLSKLISWYLVGSHVIVLLGQ